MRALALLLAALVLPSGLSGQYVTRLKGEPVPDLDSFWLFQLEPATPDVLAGLPEPGGAAFTGVLEVLEGSDRGKVVLLDFWGTWCIPCRQDLPLLRQAFAAYRDRGFVILGMDARDELAKLQAFVAEQDVPWLHATADSVEDVIKNSFRIRGYPTKILLDREGRVVSAGDPGQPSLRGEALLKTLEDTL